jgi:hypothetical protein
MLCCISTVIFSTNTTLCIGVLHVRCILHISVFSLNHLIHRDSPEVQLLVVFIDWWCAMFLPHHVSTLKGYHQADYICSFSTVLFLVHCSKMLQFS